MLSCFGIISIKEYIYIKRFTRSFSVIYARIAPWMALKFTEVFVINRLLIK